MTNIPSYQAQPSDDDRDDHASLNNVPLRGAYTRYTSLVECPRCFMGTRAEAICPTCHMELSDANIAEEEAVKGQNLHRRGLSLSYVLVAAAVFAMTAPIFYSMGRRSVSVAQAAQTADLAASAQQVWRGLDETTRLSLKRRDYMTLLNPDSVGRVVEVSFAPIPIVGQTAPTGTPDLSLLFKDGDAWKNLTPNTRLLVIAALAKYHQAFLGDAAYPDSTTFAVQIVAPDGHGGLRRLARRDRTGHLDVAGDAAVSDSAH